MKLPFAAFVVKPGASKGESQSPNFFAAGLYFFAHCLSYSGTRSCPISRSNAKYRFLRHFKTFHSGLWNECGAEAVRDRYAPGIQGIFKEQYACVVQGIKTQNRLLAQQLWSQPRFSTREEPFMVHDDICTEFSKLTVVGEFQDTGGVFYAFGRISGLITSEDGTAVAECVVTWSNLHGEVGQYDIINDKDFKVG